MSLGRPLFVALAPWAVVLAAAGAACSVIGGSETLTDAQQVIAAMKISRSDLKAADPKGGDQKAPDLKGADLAILGAVDHADRSYRVGEPIALSVEVNKAAYVAVLRVMPSGATTLVFPNSRQATARVPAGAPLNIPEPGAPLKIAVDQPGVVLFEFIASERGGSWLFSRKPQESAEFAELGATTRALAKDIVLSLKVGHGSDTAASHLALRVRGD
ncbi:MAG TPA: DUF4384 domain-containing protein [Stellaceae bacterium]